MPYPSNYYDAPLSSSYNNNVTRRLATRDVVAFSQSSRFGGQYIEPKNVPFPYNGTIIGAVAACQQLVNELNLISPVLPDMGTPVILSAVGLATNQLGAGVSFVGGVSTTATIDGVANTVGNRVLFYGLTTSALNGVYVVPQSGGAWQRVPDLAYWWQFVKPKAFVVQNGTNNKGQVFSLQTDAFEVGAAFTPAAGNTASALTGTALTFTATNYNPTAPSGINASTLGTVGAGNTSAIYPQFTGTATGAGNGNGEYDFLAQASMAKFMYLKNRARRMAYQVFKMRENYTPFVSSYGSNVVRPIGLGNTQNNIGVSTLNNLPTGSRYPSSFNRGF